MLLSYCQHFWYVLFTSYLGGRGGDQPTQPKSQQPRHSWSFPVLWQAAEPRRGLTPERQGSGPRPPGFSLFFFFNWNTVTYSIIGVSGVPHSDLTWTHDKMLITLSVVTAQGYRSTVGGFPVPRFLSLQVCTLSIPFGGAAHAPGLTSVSAVRATYRASLCLSCFIGKVGILVVTSL